MQTFFLNKLQALKSISGGAKAVAALAVLLLLCPSLFAQITGTLTGTVTDQSDAVVPGAKVSLLNQQSQDTRETSSNNVGHFAFPAVDPGTYTLKIDAGSFAPWMHQGIVMNPGDTRNIADIKLQIGNSTNQVTVQAQADEVRPVDSGERAAVLTSKDINQLALQGRNLSELLKILPGVTNAAPGIGNGSGFNFLNVGAEGSAVGNGLNVNGVPNRGGTQVTSDGANIIDPGCNCYSIATINPDMTQEVKVQTSNFGADSAKGPVVVNNISKSGGAQYHAEGYLYARQNALNANDWLDNHQTPIIPKGADHYYYPGGNVGGPVPFTKKKVLFWFGYEHFYQNTGNASVLKAYIPSVGMMQGNFTPSGAGNAALCPNGFSTTATDWCNNLSGTILPDGSTVTNGIIPAQFLDPGATALAKIWPKPNADPATTGGFNYFQPIPGIHNGYIYRTRVDYNLSDNTKIYISYQRGEDAQPAQGNGAHIWWTPSNAIPFPGGGIQSPSHSKTLTGHFLHVFTPTLTDEFIASWGYGNNPLGSNNFGAATRSVLGYPASYGTVFKTGARMIPSYDGGANQTVPDFSQADIFENGGQFNLRKEIPAFADNLTKVWRSHTFKIGAYTENTGNYQGSYEFPNGHVTGTAFSGQNPNVLTGKLMGSPNNPTANFLMGVVTGYQENNAAPYTDMAYKTISGYVEDSWKTTRRLTLELGIRLDHISHWYDRKQVGMAAFFPNLVAPDLAAGKMDPGLRWHGMDPTVPNSGSPDRTAYVSPRFGLAWDLFGTGNTVLRGGWGAYRFNDQYNDYTNALSTAQGVQTYNLPSGSSVFLSQLGQLSPASAKWSPSNVSAVDPNDSEIPVTYAYNFTLSQQLPWRSLLEIAYVGNNSEKLLMGGGSGAAVGGGDFTNQNKMPLGALFKPDPITGIRAPNPENVQQDLNGNPLPNKYADYTPFGLAYGTNSISVPSHVGYANYNGLQTSWAKQAGRLSFNLNYTWSKTLGTGLNIDPLSVRGNYGPAAIDRSNVLNTSYTYNLPDLTHGSKFLSGTTNGWTVSGITTWQAGGNLQAINSPNFGLGLSYTNLTRPGVTSSLGDPTYFGTTAQVAIMPALTCDPTRNLASQQTAQLNCFTAPAIGSDGPRNYPYMRGAAFFDSDLSIYKTFHITERHNLQFRASAFNFLNHPLWQFSGNSQLQLKYLVDYNTHAVSLNSVSNTWGYLNNKASTPSQRIMELALKYSF